LKYWRVADRRHQEDILMSIVEKRSHSRADDVAVVDSEMSATTSICVALVVALILYVLGAAVLRQDVVARAPERAGPVEMSFHGP
jgi:hypothetical protein